MIVENYWQFKCVGLPKHGGIIGLIEECFVFGLLAECFWILLV